MILYIVYINCHIDYSGRNVTSKNFLNILKGNSDALKNIGSGKVLDSTSGDNVWIYYVDHGAVGLVAFPFGDLLYADHLLDTLIEMDKSEMFNEIVIYMEACESGSMFLDMPDNMNIFVTTASNEKVNKLSTSLL